MESPTFQHSTHPIIIAEKAFGAMTDYVVSQSYKNIIMIVDENTYKAAGKEVEDYLNETNSKLSIHCLQCNDKGDIIADEQTIVDVLIQVQPETDCLLAVGSGTIHDIVRFVSAKIGKPFISLPTAPSVDGFNSKGAPIIIKGVKTTYQTVAPVALFADVTILSQAPAPLIAAGFGDMIGKHTSLVDWKAGALIAGEAYDQDIADLTREAMEACIDVAEKIGQGDIEGIEVLMKGLVLSGIAMASFGASHPASGAEHHLSHYWEMRFIEDGHKQLFHGAKIGRSTLLIMNYYKQMVKPSLEKDPTEQNLRLVELIDSLPDVAKVEKDLRLAGWNPDHVQIDEELIQLSLLKAYHLRDRWTLLRYYHETLHWGPDL
ncbi:sn-glycerol-1-phosphate dehydrogenase [Alkalicoccobacillus porphyridii]|uniref:sn-glycerol-1-phosphate dehydrogenase n=2 Tax=Alkalicoccobacillus porphyridii TaxID=2597270 RepID=A0A554A4J1_9BACI|nr:sn-glycerol-1-phosphate dehydrogenase [Alkalicoccobacillus porphyridii]